ncbi:hypothetical protein HKBW3S42_02440 [Candidatus Hakubella thermalkaliphila]|uniref:Uncharacterized protein n=1 Tax=Candidatus Hakubella thermalkaliphila TaxID=2754717 RepID=A0A6V8PPV9_9ACTN|nr:hypothetical protein HKBW3S42_02440 [Candidatus Hakubella thermalkaliphila]
MALMIFQYWGMVNGLIRTLFNKISIVLKTMKEIGQVTRGQNSNILLLYNLTFYDGFPLLILAKIKKIFVAIGATKISELANI